MIGNVNILQELKKGRTKKSKKTLVKVVTVIEVLERGNINHMKRFQDNLKG